MWLVWYLNAQEVKEPYDMLVSRPGIAGRGVLYYFKKNRGFCDDAVLYRISLSAACC
jgi:hypothetical protein